MMDGPGMFEGTGVEVLALIVVFAIAVPSIIMLCLILDEAPLKMDRNIDEAPIFCFTWSTTDVFGQSWGTLLCLFFVAFMLLGFATLAGSWYTVWRGGVAWSTEGNENIADYLPGAFLQTHHHAPNASHHPILQLLGVSSSATVAAATAPAAGALLAQVLGRNASATAASAGAAGRRGLRRLRTGFAALAPLGAEQPAAAAVGGAAPTQAAHTPEDPTNYAREAADVAEMMDSVRVKSVATESVPKKAATVAATTASDKTDDANPDMDDELMAKADAIEEEINEQGTPKGTPAKLTLAAKKDDVESSKDRAARYFASHGMKDMGRLLGEELSATAAEAAARDASVERDQMAHLQNHAIEVADPALPSTKGAVAASSSIDDIPLDDDDDTKKRWALVDALKRRAASVPL